MHAEQVFITQRALRMRLLDHRSAIDGGPLRDLAAMLLLHLDEPPACWRLGVQWLREAVGADRVDGGFGSPRWRYYSPGVQALRPGRAVPSALGLTLNNRASSIHAVWAQRQPLLIDVQQDGLLDKDIRATLLSLGARRKLAVALYDEAQPVGLLCADWLDADAAISVQQAQQFGAAARSVLGPVLAAAHRLAQAADATASAWPAASHPLADGPAVASPLASSGSAAPADMSPAEWRVVRMVAAGLSYKEIAQQLDRSVSTIDHQLRSARQKVGVRTTARLVRWLAEQAGQPTGLSLAPPPDPGR